jgi:hypothetical protein
VLPARGSPGLIGPGGQVLGCPPNPSSRPGGVRLAQFPCLDRGVSGRVIVGRAASIDLLPIPIVEDANVSSSGIQDGWSVERDPEGATTRARSGHRQRVALERCSVLPHHPATRVGK